jgi:hypothetical protein
LADFFFAKNKYFCQKGIAKMKSMWYNNTVKKLKKIYAKIIYDLSRVVEGRALRNHSNLP